MTKSEQIAEALGVKSTDVIVINGSEAKLKDRELTESEKTIVEKILNGEPIVPNSVEKWRLEIILDEDGLLDTVNGIVSQADKRTQIAWKKTSRVNRTSKAIEGIRQAMGLTEEQVNDIFNRADEIDV